MDPEGGTHESQRPLGRIIGRAAREIRIRSVYEEDIYIGEILIAEHDENDMKFLLRVFDIEYGAEASSQDWPARTAGNMLVMERGNQEYRLHDKERRLFKVAVCTPLGYISNGTFKKPKTIPQHFSKVRRAARDDYSILKQFMGDVVVGKLRSGEDVVDFEVGISGREFPHHIGLFATTGMGKSNLMKCLAASLMENRKYGLLILDPHGEYYDGGREELKGLKHHPKAMESLEVYSARELSGPYNKIKISAHEIEIDDLLHLYEFSQPQREALNAASFKYGGSWLVDLHERSTQEIVHDLVHFQEGTISVIKRRLNNIFRYGLVTHDKTLSITGDIIKSLCAGKVVLVDTSNMYEAEELLVSIVIARAVFEFNKKKYANPREFRAIPPMLVTIEEAQRVLGKLPQGMKHTNIFAQIAREGRKFNTGLCAISQQPKLIDEEIMSQFNTLFILGLADKKDRDILRESAKQDVAQLGNEIQMLMPGEALIASPYTPFALPVKIHLYEEYISNLSRGGAGGWKDVPEEEREHRELHKKSAIPVRDAKIDEGFF
jgi:hypothetical protein